MTVLAEHHRYRLLAAAAVDGGLSADEGVELEKHLARCSVCRADAAAMLRDHHWLATPGPVAAPNPRVLAAVLREARREPAATLRPWASLLAAALVVAIGGLALAAWSLRVGSQRPPAIPSPGPGSVSETLPSGWVVTASAYWDIHRPSNALDGDLTTTWGSGDYPPAWIEIDLGEPGSIERVELVVEQTPRGNAVHHLIAMDADRVPIATEQLAGVMAQFDVLTQGWPAPLRGVRYIRVETIASPSWVAWREIRVIQPTGP